MTVTEAVADAATGLQKKSISLLADKIALRCDSPVVVTVIVPDPGSVVLTSTNTVFGTSIDLLSPDFGRVIPILGSLGSILNCSESLVVDIAADFRDIFIGDLVEGFVSVFDSFIVDAACPVVDELIQNLTTVVTDNPLVEVAGTRLPQPASVEALVASAEATLGASLPEDFTFFDHDQLDLVLDSLKDGLLTSPLVSQLIAEVKNLIEIVPNNDAAEITASLNRILSLVTGTDVELPEEVIEPLVDGGIFIIAASVLEDLISGEITTLR